MNSVAVISLLAVVTIISFVFFKPRKRPMLGYEYWNAQSISSNDLAKMFAANNEIDRLIEMLRLNPAFVTEARSFQASAAAVGIPALYRRFSVPVPETEEIIDSLLLVIGDIPGDAIYALSVLGVGSYLGAKEHDVVMAMIDLLTHFNEEPRTLMKVCDALGYIGNKLALEPLENLLETDLTADVQRAASKAYSRLVAIN